MKVRQFNFNMLATQNGNLGEGVERKHDEDVRIFTGNFLRELPKVVGGPAGRKHKLRHRTEPNRMEWKGKEKMSKKEREAKAVICIMYI